MSSIKGWEMPFPQSVASRLDSGYKPIRLFGENSDINATLEAVWEVGGSYVFPATAQQMEVISSSASDAAAGTGARTVHLHYLDANYAEQVETVTMNGVTAVATSATNILRILDFHVATAGSGLVNAGNIDVRNLADTPIYSRIATGENTAHTAVYTIPASSTAYLICASFSAGAAVANHVTRFFIEVTTDHNDTLTAGIFNTKYLVQAMDASHSVDFGLPIKVPAQADIMITAISDNAAAAVYSSVTICAWQETN